MKGNKRENSPARESTKPHAYKWYANKLHLSTVVCNPVVSERARARARRGIGGGGRATPASCDAATLPGSFPAGKQIYRSIIDFAYDWSHLHDVGATHSRRSPGCNPRDVPFVPLALSLSLAAAFLSVALRPLHTARRALQPP